MARAFNTNAVKYLVRVSDGKSAGCTSKDSHYTLDSASLMQHFVTSLSKLFVNTNEFVFFFLLGKLRESFVPVTVTDLAIEAERCTETRENNEQ